MVLILAEEGFIMHDALLCTVPGDEPSNRFYEIGGGGVKQGR